MCRKNYRNRWLSRKILLPTKLCTSSLREFGVKPKVREGAEAEVDILPVLNGIDLNFLN